MKRTASPPPPLPAQEEARLKELHELKLLDDAAEFRFDRYITLMADIFEFPIVLITLIDRDRQWFKSSLGWHLRDAPRAISFCNDTIQQEEVMVVNDTRSDPRFADNLLVTLVWEAQQLTVTQHLGNGQERIVVLELLNGGSGQVGLGMAGHLPTKMTYMPDGTPADARVWTYQGVPLANVIPPDGGSWQYQYGNPMSVITPHGGRIEYAYDVREFPTGEPGIVTYAMVLSQRRVIDLNNQVLGTWGYDYDLPGPGFSNRTTITGPVEAPSHLQTITTLDYSGEACSAPECTSNNAAMGEYPSRGYQITTRTVEQNGIELPVHPGCRSRQYRQHPRPRLRRTPRNGGLAVLRAFELASRHGHRCVASRSARHRKQPSPALR
jgi:hypothetical protein